jgi:hypothetical protein
MPDSNRFGRVSRRVIDELPTTREQSVSDPTKHFLIFIRPLHLLGFRISLLQRAARETSTLFVKIREEVVITRVR